MEYKFNLEIGDTSGDGHREMKTIFIECNHSMAELDDAYNKSVDLTGIDLIEDCCRDHEDNALDKDTADILITHLDLVSIIGTCDKKYNKPYNLENLWVDSWRDLVMRFIKLSLPDLEYNIIESESFDIGGYGLFN
jgi:hypothetical protein